MKKFTEYELNKFRDLNREIHDEVHYELALRAIRKMRPRIRLTDDEPEQEIPLEIENLRKALVNRVSAYEKKEYPYGEANFEEWAANRTDKDYAKKMAAIDRAEVLVDRLEAFERQRANSIKHELKERNLKQQDLTAILHLDKTHVSHLLNGRKPFSLEIVSRLHDVLNIPYEVLVPPAAILEAQE